jgi:hypothetical protein
MLDFDEAMDEAEQEVERSLQYGYNLHYVTKGIV